MDSIKIRQGARLNFTVYQADPESVSATFLAVQIDGPGQISQTISYTEGQADFTIDTSELPVGMYEYQVNENFSGGDPDIYPNYDNCDGDCDFPTLEICESLEVEG